VSEKAPLQNQFSERTRVGRPRGEKRRCQRSWQMLNSRALLRAKVDMGEFGVVRIPALSDNRNDRSQDFAALRSRRLLLLFCGLRMKRALD
jgi:hypothetical protein